MVYRGDYYDISSSSITEHLPLISTADMLECRTCTTYICSSKMQICSVNWLPELFFSGFQKQEQEQNWTLSSSEFKPRADVVHNAFNINPFLPFSNDGIGPDIKTCLHESGCLLVKHHHLKNFTLRKKSMHSIYVLEKLCSLFMPLYYS